SFPTRRSSDLSIRSTGMRLFYLPLPNTGHPRSGVAFPLWLRPPLSGVASRCDVAHRCLRGCAAATDSIRSSREMLSTMQDEPLSLTTLLRYASTFLGDSTVSTWTGTGVRTITYRELGAQAAQLANALTGLGIGRGDRVATFMWNNNEHMVAYIGVPAM